MRIKSNFTLAIVLITCWISCPVLAEMSSFSITYTADNVVTSWYHNGSTLPLGAGAVEWKQSDTYSISLDTSVMNQFIWNVEDRGYPDAFLAQITSGSGNIYSSSSWEVAYPVIEDGLGVPLWSSLTWNPATEYGANNDPGTVWYSYNPGPVAGIADEAQWI
jgi:hypothetical protein